MRDPILHVEQLDMHFSQRQGLFGRQTRVVRAVDQVSFAVERGETLGVVGESGSGKTTLGRCVMRILEPTSGRIDFRRRDGEMVNLTECNSEQLRRVWRDMRMVFQDPQSSLNPRLRVIDIVGQCLQKSEGLSGKALSSRVAELLEQVGLRPEYLLRYPNAFSGGQRQRLGIARALATRPELVIADEAVSALDVSIQAQTLNLLQDLQQRLDLTYIFIAHDLAVVEHICDRVAVMYLGQIVELASRDTLFSNPRHPYTQALLGAVPIPDPRARAARRQRRLLNEGASAETGGCRFASRCPKATDLCRTQPPPARKLADAEVLCHHV